MEITQSGQQTESQIKENKNNKKNESNIRHLSNNIKSANLCIIGIPEGEEREKGIKNVFEEIMAENFPNLGKETYPGTGSTEGPKQDKPKTDLHQGIL